MGKTFNQRVHEARDRVRMITPAEAKKRIIRGCATDPTLRRRHKPKGACSTTALAIPQPAGASVVSAEGLAGNFKK